MATETNNTNQPNTNEENNELQFMIQRVYVKDLSFESPNAPAIFQQEWHPDLNLEVHTVHNRLNETTFEVTLDLTVTVKNNQSIAFLIEVKQAGIFTIQGITDPQQMAHLLESFCPNILFPYAREAISTEVTRGSFPQLVLSPINFDALYLNKLAAQAQPETHSIQ